MFSKVEAESIVFAIQLVWRVDLEPLEYLQHKQPSLCNLSLHCYSSAWLPFLSLPAMCAYILLIQHRVTFLLN